MTIDLAPFDNVHGGREREREREREKFYIHVPSPVGLIGWNIQHICNIFLHVCSGGNMSNAHADIVTQQVE